MALFRRLLGCLRLGLRYSFWFGTVVTADNGKTSILDRIVAAKRKRIAAEKSVVPPAKMLGAAEEAVPALRFDHALCPSVDSRLRGDDGAPRGGNGGAVSVIAEMKRSSPSAGVMDMTLNPAQRAETYCEAGAAAVSVLTEQDFFRGSLADLERAGEVAHSHDVAVLEKDFVVDEYQIYQARAAGADTVLLIIAILDPVQYSDLYDVATGIGMEPLVEVFDAAELDVALTSAEPRIVGVNNRNLKTLTTSLDVFPALAKRIPDDVVKVAESGMRSADDVKRMADAGAKAVLVGESLMTADGDPSELISQMATISV